MSSEHLDVQAGTSDADFRLPIWYDSADDWKMFRKSKLWPGSFLCKGFGKDGGEDDRSAV